MSTFRIILAFVFSLLIIGGIWKYYAGNDEVALQDPFHRIWSNLVTYEGGDKEEDASDPLAGLPSTHEKDIVGKPISKKVHKDFTAGILQPEELDRVMQLGVVGGSPEGDLLWLHYCDFDATYCQKSYDEGIVYDYLEAYPTELSYIYKPFPPTTLEHDMLSHRAALCAMDNATSKQFFSFYNALYTAPEKTDTVNALISLGRSLGIEDMGDCLDKNNYDLVIQQETKVAKKLFAIKALPANIFINKRTHQWILVPGYYETDEVLPAIASIE